MDIVIADDERLDRVNEDITIIQKKDGLTFGTDAYLLAAYMGLGARRRAAELGTGTGIISLLCTARERFAHIDAFEVQPDFAELTRRNVAINSLEDRISVHEADVRDVSASTLGYELDAVFTNPPYMRTDSGKRNLSDHKYIARHEVCGTVADFCAAAYRLLRHGGKFYCVYRPDRLSELFLAMTANRLEPKKMTLVFADSSSEPSMVLAEAVKFGSPGMRIDAPLLMYEDGTRNMSERAARIYESMSFN